MTEYDGSTVASNKLIFTEKLRFHIDRKQAKNKTTGSRYSGQNFNSKTILW